MNFGNKLSLNRKERISGGVKAEKTHYAVNYNPSTLQSGSMLMLKIPALAQNTLIVPGSMKLVFNITITGDDESWFVNNLASNLITRFEIKWGTKTILNINNFDVLQTYKDLWLTQHQRQNMIRQGIQSKSLSKLRSRPDKLNGAETAGDLQINRVFGNKYEIPLDCSFLTDQHPFYSYIYKEEIEIDLYFQKPNLIINSTEKETITDYNLSNISFEYDTIYEAHLASQIIQLSDTFGIDYFYDYISHIGMNPINKSDLSFTLTVQDPRISVRGILMLFTLPPTPLLRDPENFYNPEITNVDITIDGITNKIFAQGFKEDRMWTEAKKYFLNESRKYDDQTFMSLNHFYGHSKYCLWIDMRSTEDNKLHGSGMTIRNGSNIALKFTKNNTGSGLINVNTYLIADAYFTVKNRFITDPKY